MENLKKYFGKSTLYGKMDLWMAPIQNFPHREM